MLKIVQILIKVLPVNSVVSVHFKNIDRDASYLLDICLHANNLEDTLSVLTCKTIDNNYWILGWSWRNTEKEGKIDTASAKKERRKWEKTTV